MSTTPPGYNPIDLPGQILDEGYGGRFSDPTTGAGLFTANTDYNVVGVDPLTGEDAPIGTDVGFGAAVRRWMQAGVYNGDFSILPNAYGDHIIDAYNMLAYWSFQPTQSGCIVAYAEPQSAVAFQADTFQTDTFQATAGSGGASQLRFKMIAGGYAEDDAHIQQLVPVATTADEVYELEAGFSLVRVQDTDPDAKAYITVEFVQGNLLASTASPNSVTIEASLATDSKATTRTDTITIPDDARYARISVGMRRGAAAETETAEFSISEVFIDQRYIAASVAEHATAYHNSGTSFPASPTSNQLYHRTDIRGGMTFRYNGTYWLSDQLLFVSHATPVINGTSYNTNEGDMAVPFDYDFYVVGWDWAGECSVNGTMTLAIRWRTYDDSSVTAEDSVTPTFTAADWVGATRTLGSLITAGTYANLNCYNLAPSGGGVTRWGVTVWYRLRAT